jgi:predicted DNA-binding protein (UPF0251 family)
MTYSADFRWKVFEIKKKENLTFEETAARFGIGKTTLVCWVKKPGLCLSRNKPAVKIDMDAFQKDVEEHPDAYLRERAAGMGVSRGVFCTQKIGCHL